MISVMVQYREVEGIMRVLSRDTRRLLVIVSVKCELLYQLLVPSFIQPTKVPPHHPESPPQTLHTTQAQLLNDP